MNTKLKQLGELFKDRGFNPVIGTMYDQQGKWLSWYRGEVNDFHYYNIKTVNGKTHSKQKASLNMAKKVGEDITGLLFNEKTRLLVNEPKAQKILDNVLHKNNFVEDISNFIEYTFAAYGTGVMIEYTNGGQTEIDYNYGSKVFVLSYNNTKITEIAVLQEFQKNKRYYTHVTYHTHRNDVYRIEHELYGSQQSSYLGKQEPLSVLFSEDELKDLMNVEVDEFGNETVRYYKEYDSKKPFFQVLKPAIANNFDNQSPLGIPVTANSISVLEQLDETYNTYKIETETAKRKIMINSEATQNQVVKERSGDVVTTRVVNYFDQDETIFQSVPMGTDTPFKEFSPEYRSLPYIESIKFHLNLLSAKTTLGTSYYSYDQARGVTATEIISRNSDTWKNRQKHVNKLEQVFKDMMYSIMILEKEEGVYFGDVDKLEFTVEFDDSIIVDDDKQLETMSNDVDSGKIPAWRYVAKRYKLSDDEAKEWVKEANEEDSMSQLFGIEQRDIVDDEDELEE
jgi:A118 family predicted phage portal protein